MQRKLGAGRVTINKSALCFCVNKAKLELAGAGSYDYFNLCDADIAADHSFDTELYPNCAPNKLNYFYKNGLIASNEDNLRKIIERNTDKEFFSVKLLFPVTQEQLAGFGYPPGKLRFNDMQNVVAFVK